MLDAWINREMRRCLDEWVSGWDDGWIDEIVRNLKEDKR